MASELYERALSKKPEDRYPTCSDFAFAVENACRASKDWKPISLRAVPNLPTLTARGVEFPAGRFFSIKELSASHRPVRPHLPELCAGQELSL